MRSMRQALSTAYKSAREATPATCNASSASNSRSVPSGTPAFLRTRAKCTTLAAKAGGASKVAAGSTSVHHRRPSGAGGACLDRLQQASRLGAADPRNVILVLEQHPQGVIDRLRIESAAIEGQQCFAPLDALRQSRELVQIERPQRLHESHDLPGESFGSLRHFASNDLELPRGIRIVHPMIDTAALHRVVNLARTVRGDDDDRPLHGADGRELRNRDLKIRQDFEQVRFERLIGPVELIDQQYGRAYPRLQRAQE